MSLSICTASRCAGIAILALTLMRSTPAHGQALTMDGASGVFFQPLASVVPAPAKRWNHPTLSYHMVDAGPVAGDYINVSVEEGFGDWLEFGYTRGNHTDGGDPTYSPLFNYAGMNIFNAKVKLVPENGHGYRWIPSLAIGGAIRTNVPYVSQYFAHKNATNGDVYGVATKVVVIEKKVAILLNGGVRGTNAEVYGYGGNATHWQARAFGAVGFPIPIKGLIVSPTFEVDQEPHHLSYVSYASIPTSLIYAVRVSRAPDSRWSIDIGTGRICNSIAPGINLKVNHAIAIALDRRF
jgi:hypothetical protein